MQQAVRSRRVNEHLRKAVDFGQVGQWEQLDGEHYVAVGLSAGQVQLQGRVGDYFASLNDGACISLCGEAGNFVADTATAGEVVVDGRVGSGLAFSLYGGSVVVTGDAGDDVAQMNKGGTILVGGDVGRSTGMYSLTGNIVVLGDAGMATGDWLVGGAIFVAGQVEGLGRNACYAPLVDEERHWLSHLLRQYGMLTDVDSFKKIVPEVLRPFYPGDKKKA